MLGIRRLSWSPSRVVKPLLALTPVTPVRYFAMDTTSRVLNLNDLQFIPGSRRKRIRWGRGTGSGRGKLCGFGHQKSRSTPIGFEGGQTPMFKRYPKIGFTNAIKRKLTYINLGVVQAWIDMGRLKPKAKDFITMRDLQVSGCVTNCKEGVKLLSMGKETLKTPMHIEVSYASAAAIKAVESVGGTVTCSHFTRLSMRALLKPYKFDILPHRARPPPKMMNYYLDSNKAGYLSPEIQTRNLKLFGFVTSEANMRKEHDNYMNFRRAQLKKQRDENDAAGIIAYTELPKLIA